MLITVFTPTYNRAYTLERVFDSLMKQSFSHLDFEWIVINDGSTDNTDHLVAKFLKKADFEIIYLKQENRGKNYCHNRAVSIARGELFLILDSDDAITPECMDVFWKYWKNLNEQLKSEIYGINCLCKDGYTGKLIGHEVKGGVVNNAYKHKHKNKIYFDGWGALNTSLFKKNLFPEIEGIKFIPEAYLWDSVGNHRKVLSVNDILKNVYYQKDGFSNDIIKSYKNHSQGRYIYHQMVINELFNELFKYNKIRLLKDLIQFGRMGFHSGYSSLIILKDVKKFFKKVIVFFVLPFSFYFYKKDCNA